MKPVEALLEAQSFFCLRRQRCGVLIGLAGIRNRTSAGIDIRRFRSLCVTYFTRPKVLSPPNMAPSRSRSRSPSPYSRRLALSNRREDRPRSRSPPRKPAYSPSPPRRDRQRSRSPRRRHDDRHRKSGGGFRWKEKPRYDDDDREGRGEGRLERGYREQERERPRQRSPDRRDSGRRERDDDLERKFGRGRVVEDKFGKTSDGQEKSGDKVGDKASEKPKRERKPVPAPTGEPMIIVNVNDRLGTKESIPCLASDPISMSYHPNLLA